MSKSNKKRDRRTDRGGSRREIQNSHRLEKLKSTFMKNFVKITFFYKIIDRLAIFIDSFAKNGIFAKLLEYDVSHERQQHASSVLRFLVCDAYIPSEALAFSESGRAHQQRIRRQAASQ